MNSQTRQINVIAELKDPYGKGADNGAPMAPGLFVTANIAGQSVPDALVIPRAGLRGADQVYLANDDGTLSIKTVSIISSNRDSAILRGGVSPGERVVTSPIRGVAEGMKIQLVEPDAASAGEQP